MNVEAHTVKVNPTGRARGSWREKYGDQHATVTVDPNRNDKDTEFRVYLERRWGPQLGDTRSQRFWFAREGAETLRDALTAALDWQAETEASSQ